MPAVILDLADVHYVVYDPGTIKEANILARGQA